MGTPKRPADWRETLATAFVVGMAIVRVEHAFIDGGVLAMLFAVEGANRAWDTVKRWWAG